MSLNVAPEKLLTDSEAVIRVWKANPELKLKDVNMAEYQETRDQLQKIVNDLAELDSTVIMKTTERERLGLQLSAMNTRLRSAARGYFGPNSSEYEQLGGTRSSERKRPARKAVAATAK